MAITAPSAGDDRSALELGRSNLTRPYSAPHMLTTRYEAQRLNPYRPARQAVLLVELRRTVAETGLPYKAPDASHAGEVHVITHLQEAVHVVTFRITEGGSEGWPTTLNY